MILYHGTTDLFLNDMLENGIQPNVHSNWENTVPSKNGYVYLSSTYALYYALVASDNLGGNPVIFEVEVDEKNLFPDEDFIAHLIVALDKKDGKKTDLMEITRDVDISFHEEFWEKSLNEMGNVAHRGGIPAPQIKRHKIIDDRYIIFNACQPVISPMNYSICSEYYQGMIKYAFGEMEFDELRRLGGFGVDHKSIDDLFDLDKKL